MPPVSPSSFAFRRPAPSGRGEEVTGLHRLQCSDQGHWSRHANHQQAAITGKVQGRCQSSHGNQQPLQLLTTTASSITAPFANKNGMLPDVRALLPCGPSSAAGCTSYRRIDSCHASILSPSVCQLQSEIRHFRSKQKWSTPILFERPVHRDDRGRLHDVTLLLWTNAELLLMKDARVCLMLRK
nr:uncharacterized protein LOC127344762 isoform X2 [Lolium perenne]